MDIKPDPQISIIIPTYNREKFVTIAIDSVLNQNFIDYEIIVIDDGSTDKTIMALNAYLNKIRYIWQENAGVSSARNAGIKEARGKWVAFLDSDDEWTKDYLATQMAQVKKFPYAVAHIANAVTVLPSGERSNHFAGTGMLGKFNTKPYLIFERPLNMIVKHAPWFLQAVIIRRDVLLRSGLFNTDLRIAEDLDLIARVSLRGPFSFCRKELVEIYRRNEMIENLASQSQKRGIYSYKSFGKVYENILCYNDLGWLEKAAIAGALCSNWRNLGNVFVMAGKRFKARHYYKKSLFLYPSIRSLIKFLATFLPLNISRALVLTGRHILPGEDIMQDED